MAVADGVPTHDTVRADAAFAIPSDSTNAAPASTVAILLMFILFFLIVIISKTH
jgi:hypothetical protein